MNVRKEAADQLKFPTKSSKLEWREVMGEISTQHTAPASFSLLSQPATTKNSLVHTVLNKKNHSFQWVQMGSWQAC